MATSNSYILKYKSRLGKVTEIDRRLIYRYIGNQYTVLSISFKVDVPTGKVGSSLLFERQRRKLPRGAWGHAPPPENFEI